MDPWLEGRIIENRRWTELLFTLRVAAPPIEFEAGQFVQLALDVDGELVSRAFSLVNAPGETTLEFLGTSVEGGAFSPRLAALAAGDRLLVSARAHGALVLSAIDDAETLWLMATGTGLAPYLSMLATEAPWRRFRNVVLVHAVRYGRDLVYRERIDAWVAGRGLRVVRFVSRERIEGTLDGRIPAAIRDGRLEAATGLRLDPGRSRVLLCGNPSMLEDTYAVLVERGLRRHRRSQPGHVLMERFW